LAGLFVQDGRCADATDNVTQTSSAPIPPSQPPAVARPRLAILSDYLEENWVSMEVVADMLADALKQHCSDRCEVVQIRPQFRRRFSSLLATNKFATNFDRLLNRHHDYLRYLKEIIPQFDYFHIADHSYAALAHVLPPERTGVLCHDVDAFRSILKPPQEHRPLWYRMMARRILNGMRRAAVVFYHTDEVARELLQHKLVDPARLKKAPPGVSPEFKVTPPDSGESGVLDNVRGRPYLLHVGSCVPRKRIDVLLNVFAAIRTNYPDLLLVKVGGEFTSEHQAIIDRFVLEPSIVHMQGLDRESLATLYRHAQLVLQPSDAEGFGLPVVEALACGAVIIASDIPVLREVGASSAVYAPPGDVAGWISVIQKLLNDPASAPPRDQRLAWVSQFSWANQAKIILDTYLSLPVRTTAV
jgi:glycosyltransferase involved in cell wall biosynthesis